MQKTIVLTVNYNSTQDTLKCAASLHKLEEVPFLVIVDNDTSDNSLQHDLRNFIKIKIIKTNNNLGFGQGNNVGLRWIFSNKNFNFVFLLNNDAIVRQDTISILENTMAKYPDAGIITPKITLMDDPKVLWYGGGEINWYRGKGKVPGFLGPTDSDLACTPRNVTFASGCAMLIRRKALAQVGGFDSRFFMYEEDLELCLRVRRLGWNIRYEPEAVINHKVHGSQNNINRKFVRALHPRNPNLPFYVYHMTKNRLLNMATHARGTNIFRFWLGFPIFLMKDCAQYAISGKWEAIFAALKGIAAFIKNRKMPSKFGLNKNA